MTPLHINLLLHYHCFNAPYSLNDPAHANSAATIEHTRQLVELQLIAIAIGSPGGYRSTERGRCLINHICNLPLPVNSWRMPDG